MNYPSKNVIIASMKTLLEEIIADYYEKKLPLGVPREIRLPQVKGRAKTIIGIRRCGKTWFMFQIIRSLLKNGFPKERTLYFNFEDDRLFPLSISLLNEVLETYYTMFPSLKDEQCYFFFDEIQNIEGWEKFIRRVLDNEKADIYISGSSAKLLSKEIATALRGRAISIEIFPFSFREFLKANGIEIKETNLSSKLRLTLTAYLKKYLTIGGFPEVQGLEKVDRINLLQELIRSAVYRDVVERYHIRNPKPLIVLVNYILGSPASLFSVNKFYRFLKSIGIKASKDYLYMYMEYLSNAYFLFPVSIYAKSEKVKEQYPVKVYVVDVGLIHAYRKTPQPDWGHILENFVFNELRKKGYSIMYFKTKKGKEVDFIVYDPISKKAGLIQVCLSVKEEKTRKREIGALYEAMEEMDFKEGIIITLTEREEIYLPKGKIDIIPAWSFALAPEKLLTQELKEKLNFEIF